jgi:glucose/arabinose dehydrogenase
MHRSLRKIVPALASVATACAPLVASAEFLSPEAAQVFTLTRWATSPGDVTDFRFLPGGRVVIVEKSGIVRVGTPQSLIPSDPLLVDATGEKGLLGVEVDPDFATNGFIYLFWSVLDVAGNTEVRVSRFTVGADDRIAPGSEANLVREAQGSSNIGGALAIGPDGKLYVGIGDGGCNASASSWFATCLTNGRGKILRVNLEDGSPPADNPLFSAASVRACGSACDVDPLNLTSDAPRKEIWAWGLRNPRRMWFDATRGNLWVGDDGEGMFQEIDLVARGKHFGWPLREGSAGDPVSRCGDYTSQSGDCVDPIYSCDQAAAVDGGCSAITAGRIVDSCTWPSPWRGSYFFGDSATGEVWALPVNAERNGVGGARVNVGTLVGEPPVAFQVGQDGNLYVAAHAPSGSIFRIAPIAPAACPPSDGGTADGGTGPGQPGGGGAGAVVFGSHPASGSLRPTGACGCSASGLEGLIALLALARVRRGKVSA